MVDKLLELLIINFTKPKSESGKWPEIIQLCKEYPEVLNELMEMDEELYVLFSRMYRMTHQTQEYTGLRHQIWDRIKNHLVNHYRHQNESAFVIPDWL